MLKAALTKAEFDSLAESQKELYADGGGLYLLQVESVSLDGKTFALEDVMGLKKALSDMKVKADHRKEQLATFDGIDAAEAKSALEKVKQYSDIESMKDDKLKRQAKAIEEQLQAKYDKELSKLREDNKKLTGDVSRAVNEHGQSFLKSEALRTFAVNKVIADWQDVLLDKVRAVTRVKPDGNGGFRFEVVHPDGAPRITNKQNSTDPMTLDELVGVEFRNSQTLGVCFEGSNASGSGAGSSGVRQVSGKHVISAAEASDAVKYRAAKTAAAKAGVALEIQ